MAALQLQQLSPAWHQLNELLTAASPAACAPIAFADGTETASLFASLGTEVMPEAEEEEEALQGSASDRDDYGGDEGDGNGVRPRRHSSSPALGAAAALPAGVRSEVAADGGEADGGSGGEAKGDAGMLRELFEGSGVRGAIDHGKVEGGRPAGCRLQAAPASP